MDPGAWKLTKIYNSTWLTAFKKGFLTYYLLSEFQYIFHEKIQLFVLLKSDQDLDPDPHWFGSLDPDRIRTDTNVDPQNCFVEVP